MKYKLLIIQIIQLLQTILGMVLYVMILYNWFIFNKQPNNMELLIILTSMFIIYKK